MKAFMILLREMNIHLSEASRADMIWLGSTLEKEFAASKKWFYSEKKTKYMYVL